MTPIVRNILMDKYREMYRAFKLSVQIQDTLERELAERKKATEEYRAALTALDTDMDLSKRERQNLTEG